MSMYQSLMPSAFGEKYIPKVLFDTKPSPRYPTMIWGTTCDPRDKICTDTKLPELKPGDWIYFENAGAYTLPFVCNFNGFAAPALHSIIKTSDR